MLLSANFMKNKYGRRKNVGSSCHYSHSVSKIEDDYVIMDCYLSIFNSSSMPGTQLADESFHARLPVYVHAKTNKKNTLGYSEASQKKTECICLMYKCVYICLGIQSMHYENKPFTSIPYAMHMFNV
jgi:hypothetical protein